MRPGKCYIALTMRTKTRLILAIGILSLSACTHRESDRLTPLMSAARNGDAASVRGLIAAGADVHEVRGTHRVPGMRIEGDNPQHGETALLFAVESGNVDSVRALLDAGARMDVRAHWGDDVWSVMARTIGAPDSAAMMRLLLSRGLALPPERAKPMLGAAVAAANREATLVLLDRVGDPMGAYCAAAGPLRDEEFPAMVALLEQRIGPPGGEALECGAHADTPRKLAYFLDHHADPDQLGSIFRPLTRLAFDITKGGGMSEERRAMITLLLRHGADPALSDKTENGSAIEVARRSGNTGLLALLTQAVPRR